jgi:hypothetical protein
LRFLFCPCEIGRLPLPLYPKSLLCSWKLTLLLVGPFGCICGFEAVEKRDQTVQDVGQVQMILGKDWLTLKQYQRRQVVYCELWKSSLPSSCCLPSATRAACTCLLRMRSSSQPRRGIRANDRSLFIDRPKKVDRPPVKVERPKKVDRLPIKVDRPKKVDRLPIKVDRPTKVDRLPIKVSRPHREVDRPPTEVDRPPREVDRPRKVDRSPNLAYDF